MFPRQVEKPKFCQVCGLAASGHHYEVASCTGCKTFFKRSVIVGASYKCKYIGKCFDDLVFGDPVPGCRACRFDRCEKVGMNKARFQKNVSAITKQPKPIYSNICDVISELKSIDINFDDIRKADIPVYYQILREYVTQDSSKYNVKTIPNYMANDTQRLSFEIVTLINHVKKYSFYGELCEHDRFLLFHKTIIMIGSLTKSYFSFETKSDKMLQYSGQPEHRIVLPPELSFQLDSSLSTQCLSPLIRLKLSRVEYYLLRAIVIANPNIDGLTQKGMQILTNNRNKYGMSLFYHTMSMHQKPDRFVSLISLIGILENQQRGFRDLTAITTLFRKDGSHIPLIDCIK